MRCRYIQDRHFAAIIRRLGPRDQLPEFAHIGWNNERKVNTYPVWVQLFMSDNDYRYRYCTELYIRSMLHKGVPESSVVAFVKELRIRQAQERSFWQSQPLPFDSGECGGVEMVGPPRPNPQGD